MIMCVSEWIRDYQGHLGSVYCLSSFNKPFQFLSGVSDRKIVQLSSNSEDDGVAFAMVDDVIFCLYFDPDNDSLFCGTQKGYFYRFDLNQIAPPRKIVFHKFSIYQICKVAGLIFCASADGILSCFDPKSLKLIHAIRVSKNKIRAICPSINDRELFLSDEQGQIFHYFVQESRLKLIHKISSEKMIFSILELFPENQLLITGMDALIRRFDLATGKEIIMPIQAHWFTVNKICSLEPLNLIATASRDRSIRIWDRNTLELVKDISREKPNAHLHSVNDLCWLSKENILLSASDDRLVKAWRISEL